MKKLIPQHAVLIPDEAQRVFKGDIFDVYQWPQAMFDGTTKTFEMLKRDDTVQVIAVKDGKLVLVEDQQPGRPLQVHLPGGRADEDPDWLAAAKREMQEETGMTFKSWRLVSVEQPAAKIEWFTPIYLATDLDQEGPQNVDVGGEKINVLLQDFESVRELILSGKYPMMSYLRSLFARVQSLEELLRLPEVVGQELDR